MGRYAGSVPVLLLMQRQKLKHAFQFAHTLALTPLLPVFCNPSSRTNYDVCTLRQQLQGRYTGGNTS